jgi:aspartate aminotransferase-like enzyme
MREKLLMTPGPTEIHEDVRKAMTKSITSPDLDLEFYEFYRDTTQKIAKLLQTKNDVLILSGEGILGLEAACASLVEPGDRVLCIDNGIFGKGFGEFIKLYGGNCVYFSCDYRKPVDITELKLFLDKDSNFKFATFVHCETPSGLLNPVKEISLLLKEYGILTVVDAVSSIGGEIFKVDEWKIDIALGASQKCLSAPPGLTFLSISEDAWNEILNREKPIASFYCNLSIWKDWYDKKWFPYTQPISDIYALDKAVERILKDENRIERHRTIANGVRISLIKAGLELYPISGWSNTVTAFMVPKGIDEKKVRDKLLKEYGIMLAGAFDVLDGKVIRIGHMGENCKEEKVYITLKYLDKVLRDFNVNLKVYLHEEFIKCLN